MNPQDCKHVFSKDDTTENFKCEKCGVLISLDALSKAGKERLFLVELSDKSFVLATRDELEEQE